MKLSVLDVEDVWVPIRNHIWDYGCNECIRKHKDHEEIQVMIQVRDHVWYSVWDRVWDQTT